MVPSPCKGKCLPEEMGICTGCGRNLYEITHWNLMSDEERQEVLDRLERRMAKLERMGLLPPKPSVKKEPSS